MNTPPIPAINRRQIIQVLGMLPLAAYAPAWAQAAARRDVVVMTSYPDELVSRFEAAFEKAHPEWRLRVRWRASHDALDTLRQPGPEGIDVYWSPAARNFDTLKQEGLLRKLEIERKGLPGVVGRTRIDDPDGYYAAWEIAGYGFVTNPRYLDQHQLAPPKDWNDLADPRYAGHLVLPNPGRVGFAPLMADIPLQTYGWDKGWAIWSAAVANATLAERGGTFVADELGTGKRGIGVSIDFFVAGEITKGAPLRFAYPVHGGISPAQIGILRKAANPQGAKAFAAFVLSDAGQRMLTHPDIRRLPVRPAVYQNLGAGYYNPFAAAAQGGFGYDVARGLPRLALVGALFNTALAQNAHMLARLWPLARAATGAQREEAIRLLGAVPITEQEADRADWQQAFANRTVDSAAADALEARWTQEADARLARVKTLLGVA